MSVKQCSKCKITFECTNEKKGCWCEDLIIDIATLNQLREKYNNCLCPNCLKGYASSDNIEKK